MKKVLISFFGIAIVIAASVGATYAFFSNTEKSTGNTFTAGTLDVNILDTSSTESVPFNVTEMAPGDTAVRYLVVTNDGTEDMKWKSYISGREGMELFDVLRITSVVMNPTDFTDYGELSSYTLAGPNNTELLASPIPFSELDEAGDPKLIWDKGVAGNTYAFEPGFASVYKITVEMDPSAGNEYMGATWTGDMIIYATQENNPGW